MSRQSGNDGRAREQDAASVYGYTDAPRGISQETSGQAREEDAASVHGYIASLWANCQVDLNRPWEEGSSSWDTDSEDDDGPGRKMIKPVFVPKKERETIAEREKARPASPTAPVV
jgi:hypothetical protein